MTDRPAAVPTYWIIGGGPAGLSAALALTDPAHYDAAAPAYHVCVLQMGWRVGGKGATGRRGPATWDAPQQRWTMAAPAIVEEHGIHLFGNMYVNSLRTLNTCLVETGGPPIASVLCPSNALQLADYVGRRWDLTQQFLPYNDGEPWGDQEYPGAEMLVKELLRLLKQLLEEAAGLQPGEGVVHAAIHRVRELFHHHHASPAPPNHADHGDAVDAFEAALRHVDDLLRDATDEAARLRSVRCQIELYSAVLKGVIADGIFTGKGIDSIDHLNFIDWLRKYGMSDEAVYSAPTQMPAQMCFQFIDGDTMLDPQFSASGYLWFVVRQILAMGDAAYFFHAGTGDTVIAPLYRAAVARGVEFRFFHKVAAVTPTADATAVASITVDVQATTVGDAPYDPLVTLPDGTRAWPNRPIYGQLEQGAQLEADGIDLESWWTPWQPVRQDTITLGPDDRAVLAVPLPCIPRIAPALAAREPFASALTDLPGVATMAAQWWTTTTSEELHLMHVPGDFRLCGGAAVPPVGIADMSDVLATEQWSGTDAPKGLYYVCGPMYHRGDWPPFTDHDTPERFRDRAVAIVRQWMRTAVSVMPGAGTSPLIPEGFDPACIAPVAGVDLPGEARMENMYVRANIDPNELYVMSPPGAVGSRPLATGSGLTNLALASDWIFTGINIGSFEGAVISGMLASNALTGFPALSDIAGYQFGRPDAFVTDPDGYVAGLRSASSGDRAPR
jgi:uncharacterized protein with NAD-binding domain and iron-sulfur cluster